MAKCYYSYKKFLVLQLPRRCTEWLWLLMEALIYCLRKCRKKEELPILLHYAGMEMCFIFHQFTVQILLFVQEKKLIVVLCFTCIIHLCSAKPLLYSRFWGLSHNGSACMFIFGRYTSHTLINLSWQLKLRIVFNNSTGPSSKKCLSSHRTIWRNVEFAKYVRIFHSFKIQYVAT